MKRIKRIGLILGLIILIIFFYGSNSTSWGDPTPMGEELKNRLESIKWGVKQKKFTKRFGKFFLQRWDKIMTSKQRQGQIIINPTFHFDFFVFGNQGKDIVRVLIRWSYYKGLNRKYQVDQFEHWKIESLLSEKDGVVTKRIDKIINEILSTIVTVKHREIIGI